MKPLFLNEGDARRYREIGGSPLGQKNSSTLLWTGALVLQFDHAEF